VNSFEVDSEKWWKTQREIHGPLFSTVDYLESQNSAARDDVRFNMELASNFNVSGMGYDATGSRVRTGHRMRYNLTQSACDTGASLILSSRTVPIAMTVDGDYSLARTAERWTRAIQGQMYQLKVFEIAADIGVDGLQTGTGVAIGYVERDENGKPRPCIERVLPNELMVDCVDGMYRSPRSMYRSRLMPREAAIALWPKYEAQIRVAGGPSPRQFIDMFIKQDNRADFVRIVEAWHLPSGPGKNDGRHVIAIDNQDLRVEPYTADKFPLVVYRYVERRIGFWGQGLVERVMPAQVRLSELQQAKRDMQRLCSNPYMMIEENSNVSYDDMTNMPGQQVKYRGTMPQLVVFEGTPNDLSAEEAQIKQEVWEQEGFATSVQQGEVNKGLASARAVRAADDVASRRHVMPIRLVEQMYLDFVQLIAMLNDQCAAIDPDYTVVGRYRSGGKSWIKTDRWSEIRLPENDACVNVFPISALPTTPQGAWSALEEMTQAGYIGKNMSMELMQMPDTEAFVSMNNSNLDLTRYQIDQLFDGIPVLPIPQQFFADPAETPTLVTQAMLVAYRMNAPQEVIDLFEQFLSHCKVLIEADQAPPPATIAPAALNPAAAAAMAIQQPAMPAAMPVAA
jgi:hypothetical protein